MKIALAAASVLACAFSLDAQITATLNALPDGGEEVRIRNNSAVSVIAFVVTAKHVPRTATDSDAPIAMYSDPLIDPASMPLPAGQERLVTSRSFQDPSGRRIRTMQEPLAAAGILADGTTAGDAALLTRLLFRRSNMLLAVETTLETLSDAGRRNIPRDQLIEQFKKMAELLRRWYLPLEQQIGLDLYQSFVRKLMDLPPPQLGSPFPPTAFVAQETAMLRQQRLTLMESQPSLADAALLTR